MKNILVLSVFAVLAVLAATAPTPISASPSAESRLSARLFRALLEGQIPPGRNFHTMQVTATASDTPNPNDPLANSTEPELQPQPGSGPDETFVPVDDPDTLSPSGPITEYPCPPVSSINFAAGASSPPVPPPPPPAAPPPAAGAAAPVYASAHVYPPGAAPAPAPTYVPARTFVPAPRYAPAPTYAPAPAYAPPRAPMYSPYNTPSHIPNIPIRVATRHTSGYAHGPTIPVRNIALGASIAGPLSRALAALTAAADGAEPPNLPIGTIGTVFNADTSNESPTIPMPPRADTPSMTPRAAEPPPPPPPAPPPAPPSAPPSAPSPRPPSPPPRPASPEPAPPPPPPPSTPSSPARPAEPPTAPPPLPSNVKLDLTTYTPPANASWSFLTAAPPVLAFPPNTVKTSDRFESLIQDKNLRWDACKRLSVFECLEQQPILSRLRGLLSQKDDSGVQSLRTLLQGKSPPWRSVGEEPTPSPAPAPTPVPAPVPAPVPSQPTPIPTPVPTAPPGRTLMPPYGEDNGDGIVLTIRPTNPKMNHTPNMWTDPSSVPSHSDRTVLNINPTAPSPERPNMFTPASTSLASTFATRTAPLRWRRHYDRYVRFLPSNMVVDADTSTTTHESDRARFAERGGAVTFFAPSDRAMTAAQNEAGFLTAGSGDAGTNAAGSLPRTLTDFATALHYHVLRNQSLDTLSPRSRPVPTLLETALTDPRWVNLGPGMGQVMMLHYTTDTATLGSGLSGDARTTARLLTRSIPCANGVLYIVDRVLPPPRALPDLLSAAGYSSAKTALQSGAGVGILAAGSPAMTFLIPSNPAVDYSLNAVTSAVGPALTSMFGPTATAAARPGAEPATGPARPLAPELRPGFVLDANEFASADTTANGGRGGSHGGDVVPDPIREEYARRIAGLHFSTMALEGEESRTRSEASATSVSASQLGEVNRQVLSTLLDHVIPRQLVSVRTLNSRSSLTAGSGRSLPIERFDIARNMRIPFNATEGLRSPMPGTGFTVGGARITGTALVRNGLVLFTDRLVRA